MSLQYNNFSPNVQVPKDAAECKVSFYKSLFDTIGEKKILKDVLQGIINGDCKNEVEQIRRVYASEGKSNNCKNAKKRIGNFTSSGVFAGGRKAENLEQHTGFIVFDIDQPKEGDKLNILEIKEKLRNDPFVYFSALSVSGDGLWGLLYTKPVKNADEFRAAFHAMESYFQKAFSVDLDPQPKDISRTRIMSYDPDAVWNEEAFVFEYDATLTVSEELSETTVNSDGKLEQNTHKRDSSKSPKPTQKKFAAPLPKSLIKMTRNCKQVSRLVEKAEKENHLLHEERVAIANLGKQFGDAGIEWVKSVLGHCSDYNEATTMYQINSLLSFPIRCDTFPKDGTENLCENCKAKWNTPASFGYITNPSYVRASNDIARQGKILFLLERIAKAQDGVGLEENPNHYVISYNEDKIYIRKKDGVWNRIFNLVDLVQFLFPNEWLSFLTEHFSASEFDPTAIERSDMRISDIFPRSKAPIYFENYLSEKKSELQMILTDNKNYNIIAQTGSGKTQALIDVIQENKINAFFLTPYEGNVKQLSIKYSVAGIHGTVSQYDVERMLMREHLIVSTYDGLDKIVKNSVCTEEFVLVVDECHDLITQASFRRWAVSNILREIPNFKKVIFVTGTPEGTITNDYDSINFIKQNEANKIGSYYICESDVDTLQACAHLVLTKKDSVGKTVVFINDTEKLEILKGLLIEKNIAADEIEVLSAENKDGEVFRSITHCETILSKIKFLLCTSVISDGVNIMNDDIENVIAVDIQDMIILRQFVARFRTGVTNVYDIIPRISEEKKQTKWFDYPVILRQIMDTYERHATEFTELFAKRSHFPLGNFIPSNFKLRLKEEQFLYFDSYLGKVEIKRELIAHKIIESFHYTSFSCPERRKEYVQYFLYVSPSIALVKGGNNDIELIREEIQRSEEETKTDFLTLLSSHPKSVATIYLQSYDRNRNSADLTALLLIDLYDMSVDLNQLEAYSEIVQYLKSKKIRSAAHKYISLRLLMLPHTLSIEVLRKRNAVYSLFSKEVRIHRLLLNKKQLGTKIEHTETSMDILMAARILFLQKYFASEKNSQYTVEGVSASVNQIMSRKTYTKRTIPQKTVAQLIRCMIVKKRHSVRRDGKSQREGYSFIRFRTLDDTLGKIGKNCMKYSEEIVDNWTKSNKSHLVKIEKHEKNLN